ncbi:MAG: hypothetical protein IKU64_05555 [Bacteroides sp.]|nr:hypothetical protein [Bacteroides sp.]
MKQWKYILPICLLLMLGALAGCVHVELADLSKRANSSLLRITFNWNGYEEDKPERLHLIGVRNMRTWRVHGFVDTEDGDHPWFGYSEPIIEEEVPEVPEEEEETPEEEVPPTEGGEEGSTEGEAEESTGNGGAKSGSTEEGGSEGESGSTEGEGESSEGEEGDSTENEEETEEPEEEERFPLRLKGGEYNMLAVNYGMQTNNMVLKCLKDGKEVEVSENGDDPNSLNNYLNDFDRKANELYLCVKPLTEKPEIVHDKDLPDFNPRYEYLADVPRIFYTLQMGVNVVTTEDTHVKLDMKPISQEVKVQFTVEVESGSNIVITEDPIVELSGICGRFNLMEAYVDTTTLYRSAVIAKLQNQSGNRYEYEASFHTLGVVPSYDENYLNGPGIFQVAVKVAKETQLYNEQFVYAGINPHTELTESRIIEEGPDGKIRLRFTNEPIVIVVEKALTITNDYLIKTGEGLGWEQQKPTDVDIDI